MDLTTTTITLSSVIAVVGCLIGVLNFISNYKKSSKSDEARLVKIEAMLVKIDENTSDLKQKVDSHDKWLTKHESRIGVMEEKCKKRGF